MFPSSRQSPPYSTDSWLFFVRSKKNHPRFVETTTNSGIIASPLLLTFKFKLGALSERFTEICTCVYLSLHPWKHSLKLCRQKLSNFIPRSRRSDRRKEGEEKKTFFASPATHRTRGLLFWSPRHLQDHPTLSRDAMYKRCRRLWISIPIELEERDEVFFAIYSHSQGGNII